MNDMVTVVAHIVRPDHWSSGNSGEVLIDHYARVFRDEEDADQEVQDILDDANVGRGKERQYNSTDDYNRDSEYGFIFRTRVEVIP